MKGLIIKDLMCIRKQRKIFIYTVLCVVVLSVMFVLSAKNGNISSAYQMMMVEDNLSEVDIRNLSIFVLILFMLLPIATVADVATIIMEDGKAGFEKVSSIIPISIEKRVLAKYITVSLLFGIGMIVDTLIAFVLSRLTNIISFGEFLGIIIAVASLMFLYGVLTIVYSFGLGYGKESYAQMLAIITIIVGTVVVKFKEIKKISGIFFEESTTDDILINDFINWMKYKSFILLFIVIGIAILSYWIAVIIAKKKRGIV